MTTTTASPSWRERLSAVPAKLTGARRRARQPARDFFVHALGQVRLYRDGYAGVMHGLIFWGVTIQILGTAINLMQMALFIPFVELPFPRGNAYLAYELVMDLAGVAILLGVILAVIRRFVLKPAGLETSAGDVYALVLLAVLPIFGFLTEAVRIVAVNPPWAAWSPVGNAVASLLSSLGITSSQAASMHNTMLWTHVLLGLLFVASIPFTKLRHLLLGPLNILKRDRRKEGTLSFIDDIETAETLGVGQVTEFEPAQLLSFDSCVNCGRCERNCPATLSGMSFSPRAFIQDLRGETQEALLGANGAGNGAATNGQLAAASSEEIAWACTTCGACLSGCPIFVNPVDEIIDLRRYQVLSSGRMPGSVGATLRNLEQQGNPWGMPATSRTEWAEGLNVRELAPGEETDVLLFLGCAFAFDDRNQRVARDFVRVLQTAGVDFAILGMDEGCCGETARRLGHEYLYQVFAEQNIEVLSSVSFKRIVTQCPHCFNTLKNEYPQLGGDWLVQHYSEYLLEKLPALQPMMAAPNGDGSRVTYHDPCYLGRYNGEYSAPRQLVDGVATTRVEMERHGQNSFCCGGGGGQMWMETAADERINQRRLDDVLAVEASTVVTACPYCMIMFDDAIRSTGVSEQVQVIDIAEMIAGKLDSAPAQTVAVEE